MRFYSLTVGLVEQTAYEGPARLPLTFAFAPMLPDLPNLPPCPPQTWDSFLPSLPRASPPASPAGSHCLHDITQQPGSLALHRDMHAYPPPLNLPPDWNNHSTSTRLNNQPTSRRIIDTTRPSPKHLPPKRQEHGCSAQSRFPAQYLRTRSRSANPSPTLHANGQVDSKAPPSAGTSVKFLPGNRLEPDYLHHGLLCAREYDCQWADCRANFRHNDTDSDDDFQSTVREHVSVHAASGVVCCWRDCSSKSTYASGRDLERHIRTHLGRRWLVFCATCGHSQSRTDSIVAHRIQCAGATNENGPRRSSKRQRLFK